MLLSSKGNSKSEGEACEPGTTPTKTARITIKPPNSLLKIYSPTKTDTQNHRLQLKSFPDLSICLELITGSESRRLKDIRGPICVSGGKI